MSTDNKKPKTIGRLSKYEMEACITKIKNILKEQQDAHEEVVKMMYFDDPDVVKLAQAVREIIYTNNRQDIADSIFSPPLKVGDTVDSIREAFAEELRDDKLRGNRYSEKRVRDLLVFKAQELSTLQEIIDAVVAEVTKG